MGAEEDLAAQEELGGPAVLTGRMFRDMAGALELLTVYLGERLGLYQALYADGPATSAELAARTGTTERYISGNGWNTMPLAGCWRWTIRRLGRWLAGTACPLRTCLFSPTPAMSATRRSAVPR
jgi:hypothetical protein